MNTPPRALLLEGIDPAAEAILAKGGICVTTQTGSLQGDALKEALHTINILGIRSKTSVSADILAACPNLLAIGCFCIGTDQVALTDANRRGIAVFNSPFSNTRSVAELTIAEIVVLHRRLLERSSDLHEGRWNKTAQGANEIRGRTLGIVGYGHIGSQLSVLAEAMGMRVLYHDVAPKMAIGNAQAAASLNDLLAACDVISVHVPDTPTTKGLFDRAAFEAMRKGAIFINNARGTVVDLDALAAALKSGHLRGAAVDVFMGEPRTNNEPFSTPLAGLPNVILTPHIGGSTHEAQQAIAQDTASKLLTYVVAGSTLSSVSVPQVDLPPLRDNQSRILHFHRNVPGVLSRMHAMLAEMNVNIYAEYLQSDLETSYVILDVDAGHDEAIEQGMAAIDETIRVRRVSVTSTS